MEHQAGSDTDFNRLMALANSDTGRQLLDMLNTNSSAEMNNAVLQAQNGDISMAANIVRQLLNNPDAAELIQKLRGSL